MIERIRAIAADWLKKMEVDCFIGYTQKADGKFVPICIHKAEEADKLDFGEGCFHNLMSYVDSSKKDKIGVLLKGCDGRSFVQLLAENRISREYVKVLGIACPLGHQNAVRDEKCKSCYGNTPPIFDEYVETQQPLVSKMESALEEVSKIEDLPMEQRAEYFKNIFSQCIRCYACREVCPMCYCEQCIAEKSDPQWVEVSIKPSSNYYWNMTRALHLAGRCVGCGECSRVCPAKIPLYLLHQKMMKEVNNSWGYTAGTDTGGKLLDLDFKNDNCKESHK